MPLGSGAGSQLMAVHTFFVRGRSAPQSFASSMSYTMIRVWPPLVGIRAGATYNLTVAAPELAGFAGVAAVRHDANGHSYESVSTASAMTHSRASLGLRPDRARYTSPLLWEASSTGLEAANIGSASPGS